MKCWFLPPCSSLFYESMRGSGCFRRTFTSQRSAMTGHASFLVFLFRLFAYLSSPTLARVLECARRDMSHAHFSICRNLLFLHLLLQPSPRSAFPLWLFRWKCGHVGMGKIPGKTGR